MFCPIHVFNPFLIKNVAIILFNDNEKKVAEGVVHRMVKRAVEMEGTVTGEHGVGLVKRDYLSHELGESTVDLMRRVGLALKSNSVLLWKLTFYAYSS